MEKPKVLIIGTGGTIAGKAGTNTEMTGYQAGAIGVGNLISAVPEMRDFADVTAEQFCNVGSFDLTWEHLLGLSRRVNDAMADDVDGVVITHGTDSLEETAYFLNLTVRSAKPVVIVGAMRPATAISADGPANLLNAVRLAASTEAVTQGVLIAMNDQISGARDTTKTNTTHVETFKSPELGYLGYFQNGLPVFYKMSLRKHTFESEFDISKVDEMPRVEIVTSYVGVNGDMVEAAVAAGAKGIVVAGFGHGNIHRDMIKSLTKASEAGVVIVRGTRVANGIVSRNDVYDDYGFIASDSLNVQKARILLSLALTKTNNPDEIRRMFAVY